MTVIRHVQAAKAVVLVVHFLPVRAGAGGEPPGDIVFIPGDQRSLFDATVAILCAFNDAPVQVVKVAQAASVKGAFFPQPAGRGVLKGIALTLVVEDIADQPVNVVVVVLQRGVVRVLNLLYLCRIGVVLITGGKAIFIGLFRHLTVGVIAPLAAGTVGPLHGSQPPGSVPVQAGGAALSPRRVRRAVVFLGEQLLRVVAVPGGFPGAVAVFRHLPEGVDRPGLAAVVRVVDGDQITGVIPFIVPLVASGVSMGDNVAVRVVLPRFALLFEHISTDADTLQQAAKQPVLAGDLTIRAGERFP